MSGFFRGATIIWVVLRYGLDELVLSSFEHPWLRLLARLVSVGRDLGNLLNMTDKAAQKRGDEFIASEMFLLALADDKGEAGRLCKQHGLARKPLEQAISAVRGGAGDRGGTALAARA